MRAEVVTFGEIMLRLCPEGYERIVQAQSFGATYAGSEASVAVDLCCLGVPARFVSKVPYNPVGQAAVNALRRYGVGTQGMVPGGERLGIYFAERGMGMRAGQVVYDRANSAMAQASPADFDWDSLLDGAAWLHFSGITPALGGQTPRICEDACRAAHARGIPVSIDVNFRRKLWEPQRAGEVLSRLLPGARLVFCGTQEMEELFGIACEEGASSERAFAEGAARLCKKFGVGAVATTLREGSRAQENMLAGLLFDGAQCHVSREYDVCIVDRLGGGDAYAAGLICSLLKGETPARAVEFAAAAACLKHTCDGDFMQVTAQEVAALADGAGGGRVRR